MLKILKDKINILRIQVFLMIFLSAGCVSTNGVLPIEVQMALWAILALSLIRKAKISLNTKKFVYALLLMVIVVLSDFFNGERSTLTLLMVVMIFVSWLFVERYSFVLFSKVYADVMVFLSVTSLIGYTACLLVPSLQLYNVIDTGSRTVANFYIYVHSPYSIRNFGFFWEPGAFQAFLSVAILFEIYRKDSNIMRFVLFIVTSATTFSTTGYITIGLIAVLVLLKHSGPVRKLRRTVFVILPVAVALIVANAAFLTGNEGTVFGKLTGFVENKDYVSGSGATTTNVRYFSIVKPLEEFSHSPILGCGYENLQKRTERFTENMNTCTFVNYLAQYGIFYGLIMFIGYFRICSAMEKKSMLALYLFLLFFVITMSENLIRVPLFNILPLFGLAGIKVQNNTNNC